MNCILLQYSELCDNSSRVILRAGDRRFTHVRTVLKASVGDQLTVGIIDGMLGAGIVESSTADAVELTVSFNRAPPQPAALTLCVALPRPKSLRKVIHAATTLGIKRIIFFESWRVDKSYWQSPFLHPEYLHKMLVLGLEQAVDTRLPVIEIKKRFRPFVEDDLAAIVSETLALVAHPLAAQPLPAQVNGPVTLLIGPEGGLIPIEIDLLVKHGCLPVSLGQRILRVEEAVAAIIGRLLRSI
jgi:16S rRNA (uracil1498-N3)-methyltransferase